MHEIETSCLSRPFHRVSVSISKDSSIVLFLPDGNYSNRDSIVRKLVDRNLLKELQLFEIDVNNKGCENATFLVEVVGPINRGRYVTCDPKLLLNWIDSL